MIVWIFFLCLKYTSFSEKPNHNDLIGTEAKLLYRDTLQIETNHYDSV